MDRGGGAASATATDAMPDAAPDGIDAAPVCPTGSTEIAVGASSCIEINEHGTDVWDVAKAACETMGWRLCPATEWQTGCTSATGLVDITDGNWEWMAEESGGIAFKRGVVNCTDEATHVITDPYDYRCCVNKG